MAGVGGIIYNDNLNNVNRLNDDIAKANARVKALETDTGLSTLASRVAAVESSSSSSTSGLATLGTRVTAVEGSGTISLLAVTSNTC